MFFICTPSVAEQTLAVLLLAGKDATEEFEMLHSEDILEKYAEGGPRDERVVT